MENKCENCIHYKTHYAKTCFGFIKTGCGHCMENRNKKLKQDCKNFCEAAAQAEIAEINEFVKKSLSRIELLFEEVKGYLSIR